LAALAAIDPQEMVERVLAYGETIGKDLRFGIEPASSALIAACFPQWWRRRNRPAGNLTRR